jgi:Flp pilus assembly protein TadG
MNSCVRRIRRGVSLIWVTCFFIIMIAFASMAVDYGRVQVAKTELLRAADAAARAACGKLDSGVSAAQNAAMQTAAANKADSTAVNVTTADIDFGTYNTATGDFAPLTGAAAANANAVRVWGRRTVAHGDPIQLNFARLIGRATCDVTSEAIATISPPSPGYVGLSLTRMFNTTMFDGYNSSKGAYGPGNSGSTAVLLGNTDLLLDDESTVKGSAHWGPGGTLTISGSATVTPGPCSQLASVLSFPPVTLGTVKTSNNNSNITKFLSGTTFNATKNQGTVTFTGGTFYLTTLDVAPGTTILFNGATTIYLDGGAQIQGTLANSNYRPYSLVIKVTKGHSVKVDPGIIYAHIYNPEGDVHHHNGGQSYGSVVSDLLCFRHTSQGHYDLAGGGSTGLNIQSVK